MIEIIKSHKEKIALAVGFVAVASLGYFGGQSINKAPATQPAKSSVSSSNYTQENSSTQTAAQAVTKTTETSTQSASGPLNCQGKIKGSSSMIYHMPDGAFYKRVTNPIRCFDIESAAIAAGFRKSSK